jgi:hypothetical protein
LNWTLNPKSFWPLNTPQTIILFILTHTLNKWFQDFDLQFNFCLCRIDHFR